MIELINPAFINHIEINKRWEKIENGFYLKYRIGDVIPGEKCFFGLFKRKDKIAKEEWYFNRSYPFYNSLVTYKELNDIYNRNFANRFEVNTEGKIYYKPFIRIYFEGTYITKYFNTDKQLNKFINREFTNKGYNLNQWISYGDSNL